MNYPESSTRLSEYRAAIAALRQKIRSVQQTCEPELVTDYELGGQDGPTKLSELFGAHETLFVVLNMGRSCPYCTLWADGLNGVVDHLRSRAAFVVSSPDAPEVQREFAESRGWKFSMVSHATTSFAEDMGYRQEGRWLPGISVFRRTSDGILRLADTEFGPGDDFCAVWHLFDLIPEGADGWQPKYQYAAKA